MSQAQTTRTGETSGPDRRRFPRFDAMGRVLGTLVAIDLPVRVRDVGFGGFATETVDPIPGNEVHRVRFTTADDWSAELQAQSLYCRPSCAADGTPRYVTGFAFTTPESPDTQRIVGRVIESITSVQLYDA